MVPPPSMIFRRARHSHRASVMDVPNEAEPVVQSSNRNTMPLDGLRRTTLTMASSLERHRRSPPARRVGIERVSASAPTPTPTPTGNSITAHNSNILRTVSTSANSLSPSITQNNLQFIETLQVLNNSSNNTFTNPIIPTSARDYYSFHGPVTLTVHPDLINQILRTQPIELRGLDSSPSFSDLQGSVSPRPWVDADALERGDGLETPTIGMNRNSRLGRFINRDVFRAHDTSNLVIVDLPQAQAGAVWSSLLPRSYVSTILFKSKTREYKQKDKQFSREKICYESIGLTNFMRHNKEHCSCSNVQSLAIANNIIFSPKHTHYFSLLPKALVFFFAPASPDGEVLTPEGLLDLRPVAPTVPSFEPEPEPVLKVLFTADR
ncbi:hypothetical protein K435DRAFT_870349 [Dendrothele bispora CBS 962.96]|uniref:Uncharacterized protein n=1 Tax=Dendrothele bispora (strain CBS 962.96) TaxID=1314807 RepID=A0A4S8L7H8_DENBC|nr:hypothetical protein K435DRAFT_870349 [Dendrothele bispora CBS 962.96]